jgi:nucleoside-diphosphate-sugar epimerase
MDVLVTGGAGRIGRPLVELLSEEGHRVRALVAPGDRAASRIAGLDRVEVIEQDLIGEKELDTAVEGVDAVVHLAAALTTHEVPDERFVSVNVGGTFRLLQAVVRRAPAIRRFVQVSSDAVYWAGGGVAPAYLPIDESYPGRPGSVYGATKVAGEELCRSFFHSYGVPFTVMRPTATAEPSELIEPDSVFGRRWFVGAALRWLARRPRPTEAESELAATLTALGADDETLFSLVDEDGRPSLSMIGDPRDAAGALRRMIDADAAVGEAFNVGPIAPHADDILVRHLGDRLALPVVEVRHRSVRPSWFISSAKARSVLGHATERTVFDMVDEAVDARAGGGA